MRALLLRHTAVRSRDSTAACSCRQLSNKLSDRMPTLQAGQHLSLEQRSQKNGCLDLGRGLQGLWQARQLPAVLPIDHVVPLHHPAASSG